MYSVSKGQTALITGASSGIGYELAKCFARDGYNLIIVSRTEDALERIANELSAKFGVKVIPMVKDLFLPNAASELYEECKAAARTVDILVNDAGQGEWGEFHHTDLQRQLDIIQLNITSFTTLTYLFGKDMLENGMGKILNLGSIAATMPHPLLAVYAATKAYVVSFSEALHNELKDKGITVTTLMPGPTDTDFFHKADMEHTKAGQGEKYTAAEVAEAGYKALMDGDDRILPGFKTKLAAGLASFRSDEASASSARTQMEPEN